MRTTLLALAAAALATAAPAHDFWLDLPRHRIAPGEALPLRFLIGGPGEVEPWETLWRKVVSLRSYGPGGVIDHQATIRPGLEAGGATLTLATPGTHVVAFESYHSEQELPAAEFTAYAEHEGLTPALEARRAAGKAGAPGRELYSRRAKALVQVGPIPTDDATRPIGLTLELVPVRNPFALKAGEPLELTVLFRGRPLQGASVVFEPLTATASHGRPQRSGPDGRVRFAMPGPGRWKANVVWTAPIDHPRADFDTIFASLTFES